MLTHLINRGFYFFKIGRRECLGRVAHDVFSIVLELRAKHTHITHGNFLSFSHEVAFFRYSSKTKLFYVCILSWSIGFAEIIKRDK